MIERIYMSAPLGIIRKKDNLMTCPSAETGSAPFITLGDMHGNALKLFYILIQKGVLQVDKAQYAQFYTIYNKPVEKLTPQDINDFKQLVDIIPVKPGPFIRILGDELADRGSNDFYTLYLLKHLHANGVAFDINQSNHSLEFTLANERATQAEKTKAGVVKTINYNEVYKDSLGGDQSASMANMGILLAKKLISAEELNSLVRVHQQHQTIVSYSLDKNNSISLYSHAPMGFAMIKHLAKKFEVRYKDDTAQELAYTIENINKKYVHVLREGLLHQYITQKTINAVAAYDYKPYYKKSLLTNKGITAEHYPLEFIVWGRDYKSIDRHSTHKGAYQVTYVHGHDLADPDIKQAHIICLDNFFGKGDYGQCGAFRDAYGPLLVDNPILHQDNRLLKEDDLIFIAAKHAQEQNTKWDALKNGDYGNKVQQIWGLNDNEINMLYTQVCKEISAYQPIVSSSNKLKIMNQLQIEREEIDGTTDIMGKKLFMAQVYVAFASNRGVFKEHTRNYGSFERIVDCFRKVLKTLGISTNTGEKVTSKIDGYYNSTLFYKDKLEEDRQSPEVELPQHRK